MLASSLTLAVGLLAVASRASAGCFALESPSVCTDWSGYTIRSTDAYGNTAQFDSWLMQRLPNTTAVVSQWKNLYGCTNYNGTGIRYFTSFLCALTVDQAAFPSDWYGANSSSYVTCKNKDAKIIPLCQDTCFQSRQSFVSMLNNSNVCTPFASATAQQQANRETTVSLFTTLCTKLPTTNRTADVCFDGDIPLESQSCGYTSVSEGTNYCSTTGNAANDPCCFRSTNSINVGAVVGGVVGGIILVALIVGGIIIYRRRASRTDENMRYNANANATVMGFLKKRDSSYSDERATKGYTMYGNTFTLNHNASSGGMYGDNPYGNQYDSKADEFYPVPQSAFNKETKGYNEYPMSNTVQAPAPAYSTLNNMKSSTVPLNDVPLSGDVYSTAKKNRQSYLPQLDGKFVRVVAVYLPNMADELMLNVDDLLKVEDSFDDGWAYGKNFATGQEGFFPMACCISEVPADMPKSINKRVSSFYGRK